MFLSIGWLMVSWWPHDNLHMHTGIDLQKLLYIEYGFHVTLMVCAIVLAYCFLSLVNRGSLRAGTSEPLTVYGGKGEVTARRRSEEKPVSVELRGGSREDRHVSQDRQPSQT